MNKPEDCSFSKRSVEVAGEFFKGKVVPEEGLEPTIPRGKRILNPPRLPIPPLRQPYKIRLCEQLSVACATSCATFTSINDTEQQATEGGVYSCP